MKVKLIDTANGISLSYRERNITQRFFSFHLTDQYYHVLDLDFELISVTRQSVSYVPLQLNFWKNESKHNTEYVNDILYSLFHEVLNATESIFT